MACAELSPERRTGTHGLACAPVVVQTRMEYLLAKSARRMVRAGVSYDFGLEMFRRTYLLAQLEAHGWNKAVTAEAMGMHPSTLDYHCEELGIEIPKGLRRNRRPGHGRTR